jgi:hypothetical protein
MELLMKTKGRFKSALRQPPGPFPAFFRLFPALLLGSFLLPGCVSLVDKAGRVLDGSAFEEKTLAVYRAGPEGENRKKGPVTELRLLKGKDGTEYLEFIPGAFPYLRLRGSAPDGEGNFYLLSLRFLSAHVSGWNEFTLDLSGTGQFIPGEGRFRLRAPPEPVQIRAGNIGQKDERISGDRALVALRNRYERILALTEWMRSQGAPLFEDARAFENYWKPLLLPELVPGKKRPPDWKTGDTRWVRAEDVRWNTQYTRAFFPESLWALRDSGALLRDWAEALPWIYFEYEREEFLESMQREMIFTEMRLRYGNRK